MSKHLLPLFIIVISAALFSCNAPHDNPVDPENPDNTIYYIDGTVYSAEASSKPLENVTVTWKTENISVLTESSGYFKVKCSKLTDGWLVFSKDGFSSDSVMITWGTRKTQSINKKLNDLPVLDSIYVYSSIKNKYSLPEKQLIIEAYASDKDNDIDTLIIYNSELQINKALDKISSKYFEGKFNDYDLNLNSIEELIGKKIEMYASVSGKRTHIGNSYIKRVITDALATISPSNSDTLSISSPTLKWTRFEPGFTFTYMVEIYTDEPEPKLLYRKENISSDDISLNVPVTITPTADNNKFFWVIWSIDEYKDRSRSKPAGFVVLPK